MPSYYVPDAYREWGIDLFDWQTQSSSCIRNGRLEITTKRLFPTQGCEADAVAFEEEKSIGLDITDEVRGIRYAGTT